MPAKKGKKGGKGKKAKKVKYVPDPDAAYKQQLNADWYLPKIFRTQADKDLQLVIEEAITASLVGDTSYFSGEKKEDNRIPMLHVPSICATLGLCLSTEQCELVKSMVAPPPSAATEVEELQQFDAALTTDVRVEQADKQKVIAVLMDMLHTRVLSYDAQILEKPNPAFPTRVLSVVYTTEDAMIRKCFEALWPACGSQYTTGPQKEKIRCLGVSEARELVTHHATTEPLFTDDEAQHMILALEDTGDEIIREDNFLMVMHDVM